MVKFVFGSIISVKGWLFFYTVLASLGTFLAHGMENLHHHLTSGKEDYGSALQSIEHDVMSLNIGKALEKLQEMMHNTLETLKTAFWETFEKAAQVDKAKAKSKQPLGLSTTEEGNTSRGLYYHALLILYSLRSFLTAWAASMAEEAITSKVGGAATSTVWAKENLTKSLGAALSKSVAKPRSVR